jgi:transcription antitermination factor NusG
MLRKNLGRDQDQEMSPPAAPAWEVQEPAWYGIHTRSRHEAKVELALQQKGLEVFLPRMIVASRRRDRRLLLKVPLFPGYLFVHTWLTSPTFHEIIRLSGVVRLLGAEGRPHPVAAEKVESLKAIVAGDRPYYPWRMLQRGMQVRISEGPLTGTVGIILRLRDRKRRLVVAVELFQRSLAVELEEEAVEPWS